VRATLRGITATYPLRELADIPRFESLAALARTVFYVLAAGCASIANAQAPRGADLVFAHGFEGLAAAAVADRVVLVGDSLALTVAATPAQAGAPLSFSVIEGPAGLSVDPASGAVAFTPLAAQVGRHPVRVRVQETPQILVDVRFGIDVISRNRRPVLAPIADRRVAPGALLALTVTASDPDPGDGVGFALDAAPQGMTLDAATGALAFVPTVAQLGEHVVRVLATDAGGEVDATAFRVSVRADNRAPQIAPIDDLAATVGVAAQRQLAATDADAGDVLRWQLVAAPDFVAVGPLDGLLQVTAAGRVGTYAIDVQVEDADGATDTARFTLRIVDPQAPVARDDAYVVSLGQTLVVPAPGVLANDSDANGDPLVALAGTGPSTGTLTRAADGGFIYVPTTLPPDGTGTLDPVVERSVPMQVAMHTAAVADLDRDGMPSILFVRGSPSSQMVALRGNTLAVETVFAATPAFFFTPSNCSINPTVADVDGDGFGEVAVVNGTEIALFEHDGTLKWRSPLPPGHSLAEGHVVVSDLDGDGTPELLFGVTSPRVIIAHNADGSRRWISPAQGSGGCGAIGRGFCHPLVADIDLDGSPDVVAGTAVYRADGTTKWSRTATFTETAFPAVGNFDGDPQAEVVAVVPNRGVMLFDTDGTVLWGPVLPAGQFIGGAPTVADFDRDGEPEIGVAWRNVYTVHETDGTQRWSATSNDPSTVTGSTVFDFDNDGRAEVVYADERSTRIHDGATGALRAELGVQSFTASDLPVVADVDADGRAEIVAVASRSNTAAGFPTGLYVIGGASNNWARTRQLWSHHSYAVVDIEEDLGVPAVVQPNWLTPGLNNFRQNAFLPQDEGRFDTFTYRAGDGALQSAPATVRIEVRPNGVPPRIVSTAPAQAAVGLVYRYAVTALGNSVGEALTYTLLQAPAGATLSPAGVLEWTPTAGQLGAQTVSLRVGNPLGQDAFQAFTVQVSAPAITPALLGVTEAQASAALQAALLAPDVALRVESASVPAGAVVAQDPAAGTPLARGSRVALTVSLGPPPVPVPDVARRTPAQATAILTGAGFTVGATTFVHADDVPPGLVVRTEPPATRSAAAGSTVALQVAGGPALQLTLETGSLIAGGGLDFSAVALDPGGAPVQPAPVVALTVTAVPGESLGPLPTVQGSTLVADLGTRGAFRLRATRADTGASSERRFTVIPPLPAGSGELRAHLDFQAAQRRLADFHARLRAAFIAEDAAALAALRAEAIATRNAIDPVRLREVPLYGSDDGFLPSTAALAAAGRPLTAGDRAWVAEVSALGSSIASLRALLTTLSATEPDVAAVEAANAQIDLRLQRLRGLAPTPTAAAEGRAVIARLLAVRIPALVRADLDHAIRLIDANPPARGAAPRFAGAAVAAVAAAGLRNRLVDRVYGAVKQHLEDAVVILAIDLLLRQFSTGSFDAITGSSLLIHRFRMPGSTLEGPFEPVAELNNVLLIGPQAVQQVREIIDTINANNIRSPKELYAKFKEIKAAAASIPGVLENLEQPPDAARVGCLLQEDACTSLQWAAGFRSVHQSGNINIPAPVIIVAYEPSGATRRVLLTSFLRHVEAN